MTAEHNTRVEKDSLGEIEVPEQAYWGAQTERARQNFKLSSLRFSTAFITTLAQLKKAAARANADCDVLTTTQAELIATSADAIIAGQYHDQFPLDIFQTGSGTSTNMNMNEVIATIAKRQHQQNLHPNDQVNASQSSNDVIPTTILVSVWLQLQQQLLPSLKELAGAIEAAAAAHKDVVKTGRTHLMDAMPLRLADELLAWCQQLHHAEAALTAAMTQLQALPQGGTAVGTGINAPAQFSERFCQHLNQAINTDFYPAPSKFAGIAGQELNQQVAAGLSMLGTVLLKISNDLRWMNSGPLSGLAEIELTALQPGSSIMPGKVNPVIPEAVAMVCAKVLGNSHSIECAAQQGNFQLNVMLPLIAHQQLESIALLTEACSHLSRHVFADFKVNKAQLEQNLARNPILVTALNARIGYQAAAAIAKQAYQEGRPIVEVAAEQTDISRSELEQLLEPHKLV
ncbi:class II fumarate hydratase [Pseudidiomarina taiwanensis]|uniref:Aspartate ammonia-lyase n=1 Tax=Pseudidiomarina taiwanensis TaxID=337250 RepID=A0A432ZP09_9GAMM|nr:class II fumarate hydratase [Pseudidiomarina taiwanensis]RUO79630.1 aspartate ammonia-lyase [Pseudidiomarina taiwanensis]